MNKYIYMILSFAAMLWGCSANSNKRSVDTHTDLYPWLAQNGTFGFCDARGRVEITPQYNDAKPFQNGFSVVAKDGKYGVINANNKVVIPLKYAVAKIVLNKRKTLVITKKEYNAWWKFWDWKILPGWTILSSGSNGPLLTTRVPWAKWKVRTLPDKETAFHLSRIDDESAMGTSLYWKDNWQPSRIVPDELRISFGKGFVFVGRHAFHLKKNGRLASIQGRLISSTKKETILVRRNAKVYRVDSGGKTVGDSGYRLMDSLTVQTSSRRSITIPKSIPNLSTQIIPEAILKDLQGRVFLSPNLSTPFPAVVQDYKSKTDTITAKEILSQAIWIHAIPRKEDYLVLSTAGSSKDGNRNAFILQPDGSWNTKVPLLNGLRRILNDGRLVFKGKNTTGILDTSYTFHSIPLSHIELVPRHRNWYIGFDPSSKTYGIYDAAQKRWQIAPRYHNLRCGMAPNTAVYGRVKEDATGDKKVFYGLLNIENGMEITPARYRRFLPQEQGKVKKSDHQKQLTFYINPQTGKEYRED